MKNTAPESLHSALKAFDAATAELAALGQLASDTAPRRQLLEVSCDLADEKALAEITRLQVVEALLPRRVANREEALTKSQADLLNASHEFIRQHLGPRIRDLVNHAKDKTRTALRLHFTDRDELETVVEKSALVVELDGLTYLTTIREPSPAQLVAYAQQLLRTWDDCNTLEAKL